GVATKPTAMNNAPFTTQYGHGLINAHTATTIAASLNQIDTASPALGQTGDHRSDHSFSSSATMSTGCTAVAQTYCTIRISNPLGYDRYLPYSLTSASGAAGWQWPGGILESGEWSVRAMQGASQSNNYFLFSK